MKTGVRFLALFALAASLGAPARLHADPWIETAELFHSGGSVGDLFGSSVALDGDVAVVGQPSPETGTGVARVFLRSGGSWSEVAALSASDGAIGDSFGASVAISGDTIVVGAPVAALADTPDEGKVYLFERPAGGWSGNLFETAQLGNFDFTVIGPDRLGSSVSISGDTVAAGAPGSAFETDGATDRGVVFVFTRPRSGWSSRNAPSAILDAAAGVAGDQLGYSVGISGNTVVAGAPGTSVDAYVWVEPQSGWAGILGESAVLTPANPILTFNGLPHWVYGGAVAIDGPTIVVTAPYGSYQDPDFGSVPVSFLFEEPTSGWSGTLNETAWLVPDEDKGGNVIFDFGQSVSISSDTVVVGEPGLTVFPFSFDDGGAFIFRKPSSGWSGKVGQYANILRVDNSERGSMFCWAVSISGASILVGAPQEPVGGHLSQGAAHVFEPGLDPVVTASFSPGSVLTQETSTLTLTITNPNASGFLWRLHTRTSTFAAGLAIDAVPNASTTCAGGGVFPGAGPGDTALGLDGG
ncbi:MAG TPA: hypothetical protein VG777_02565, partial [Thermoanaerobaculia bacterium]|nr:hypothetical protein [Thermoanaerobaculia bacterium]